MTAFPAFFSGCRFKLVSYSTVPVDVMTSHTIKSEQDTLAAIVADHF